MPNLNIPKWTAARNKTSTHVELYISLITHEHSSLQQQSKRTNQIQNPNKGNLRGENKPNPKEFSYGINVKNQNPEIMQRMNKHESHMRSYHTTL